MYIISYEKCVCFIFLVILAVLSCTGYRIDNLAMTEVSSSSISNNSNNNKRNNYFFHTSSELRNGDDYSTTKSSESDRMILDNINNNKSAVNTSRHRIRHHHRQPRARQIAAAKHFETRRTEPTDFFTYPNSPFPPIPYRNDRQSSEILSRLQIPYRNSLPSPSTHDIKADFPSPSTSTVSYRSHSNPYSGFIPSEYSQLQNRYRNSQHSTSSSVSSLLHNRNVPSYIKDSNSRSDQYRPERGPRSQLSSVIQNSYAAPKYSSSSQNTRTDLPIPQIHSDRFRSQIISNPSRTFQSNDQIRLPFDRPSQWIQNDSPTYSFPSYPITSERLSQIPSPNKSSFSPTTVNRSQRSSRRQKRGKKQSHCYHEDVSTKAYKAQIVLRVLAESMSKRRDTKYSVHFRVLEHYKNSSFAIHDHIQLTFSNGSNYHSNNCEKNHDGSVGRPTRVNLVKVDIRTTQEYVLFLNASGAHSYYPTGVPEKLRRNQRKNHYIYNMLRRVCNPNFTPRPTEIVQLEDVTSRRSTTQHRLKLVCKAKGLPIPRITWRRNDVELHGGRHVRINYKKRKSTLVIKRTNADDLMSKGVYQCVARGVDGTEVAESIVVRDGQNVPARRPATTAPPFSEIYFSKKPCDEPHLTDFCLNGGQCFMDPDPLERYCECPNGYDGKRCETKTFTQSSMYPQTAIYTCKLGLSTKYFC